MVKNTTIQLDEKSHQELELLSKKLNKTESEVVQESIHLMATTYLLGPTSKVSFIGLGQFDSDLIDLASNKKHLDDFGN